MNASSRRLILASTSPFREELLARLSLDFETASPHVDETRRGKESATELVRRLSEAKARAIGTTQPGLIIGSDQVATLGDTILGKPGSHEYAMEQLRLLSGNAVIFQTGLCLLDSENESLQVDVVPFTVYFRELDEKQIDRYLRHDRPYNCAGSFKSEGLGITLFERMEGDDPTALIGLPLIRLTTMLEKAGVSLP
ncbi:MAG: septum formation inhibitor Maf [Gammaproteobacteria bacterium]|nr:MAG: septum formation inhibitor Maf [Gammaproteobacteria bacterium]